MRQLVKEKDNSEFKPVKLRLKKIDLVSYPVRAERLVNMINTLMYVFDQKDILENILYNRLKSLSNFVLFYRIYIRMNCK